MSDTTTHKETPLFIFLRFHARRAARGAEAAEVEVTWPDGEEETLWMSEQDIQANAEEHGWQDGLRSAIAAYRENKP